MDWEFVADLAVHIISGWISLIVLIAVAQGVADLGVPPWRETLWKLAVVAGVCNITTALLDPVQPIVALLVAWVIFWIFMVKWFAVDFFAAVVLTVFAAMLNALFAWVAMGL